MLIFLFLITTFFLCETNGAHYLRGYLLKAWQISVNCSPIVNCSEIFTRLYVLWHALFCGCRSPGPCPRARLCRSPLSCRRRLKVHGCASSSWLSTPQVHPIGSLASQTGCSVETSQCLLRPPRLQLFGQPSLSFQRSRQVTHRSHPSRTCSRPHHPRCSQIPPSLGFLVQHPRQPPSGALSVETGNKASVPVCQSPI